MTAVALALTASLLWGLADFMGGLYSRRTSAIVVLLVGQVAGLAGAVALALALGVPAPDADVLAPGVLAGAGTALGIGAFYRALAVGTMSIVAPIAATGAAVPVLVGYALGEAPSGPQTAGMLVAVVGVVVASRSSGEPDAAGAASARGVGLAVVAALGIGLGLVGLDAAAESSVLWSVIVTRAVAGASLLGVALGTRTQARLTPRHLLALALVGALDATAVGLLALATTTGLLGVVSVLGSLYPLITVVLAQLLLGERLSAAQAAGVGTALAGVLLIAAG